MLVDNGSANFSHWNINYSYQKFQILLFSVHCDLNSLILRESKIFDHNNTQFKILNSQRVNFFTNFFSNLPAKSDVLCSTLWISIGITNFTKPSIIRLSWSLLLLPNSYINQILQAIKLGTKKTELIHPAEIFYKENYETIDYSTI